jgi:hypothetical protein
VGKPAALGQVEEMLMFATVNPIFTGKPAADFQRSVFGDAR